MIKEQELSLICENEQTKRFDEEKDNAVQLEEIVF